MALDRAINKINYELDKEDKMKKNNEYSHCVYCAAKIPKNERSIRLAKDSLNILRDSLDEAAEITGYYPSIAFEIKEGVNIEISFESSNLNELINLCMRYSCILTKLKLKDEDNKLY